MEKEALEEQLQEITNARDDEKLHDLVESLSADDLQRYKRELADAYLDIYAVWHYDYMCDKVQTSEGPDSFLAYLLELLAEADKIDPSHINHQQKAYCYESWADLKDNLEEKLTYLEKAEQEIHAALKMQPDSSLLNYQLVGILLNKIKTGNQYREEDFAVALAYFDRALLNFRSPNQLNLIYNCLEILEMTFPRNQYWYGVYWDKLNTVLRIKAEKDPLIYLDWIAELKRIIENFGPDLPPYAQDVIQQSVDLLKQITNFNSDNPDRLCQLGDAFAKTAGMLSKAGSIAEALEYYEMAVKYFTMAQDINPAAWTYPVYATNALMAMAAIYHAQHDKATVLALFERGQKIFLYIYKREEDFTANIYWGEFLIEYARLVYDFDSPSLLHQAEEKLLIAQELGRNGYDHPYIARAKVALKLGDREKCLAILRECKKVFSHAYATYSLSKVIEDADFASLKQEIIAIHNS
jgi:tetratricopeptide (TPR) repeat protein